MISLFCGYDAREHEGYETFVSSVRRRTSHPVNFVRMGAQDMPQGTNEFTYSRFLVPFLSGFEGHAIFCDASDMVMLADVAELDALFDPRFAVQVVRHDYNTRHPMKYVGTDMQCQNHDYPRKNWASVMLMNCEHPYWRPITPPALNKVAGLSLLQFFGLDLNDDIGSLPNEWNRLVDEGQPVEGANVLHWTAGIPLFDHYRNAPGADIWRDEYGART